MDLISRQAAIKSLCENGMCGSKQCGAYPCEDVRAIEQVPTIDPVKHGKWVWEDSERRSGFSCSECGYGVRDERRKTNYCPNCGARMERSADG